MAQEATGQAVAEPSTDDADAAFDAGLGAAYDSAEGTPQGEPAAADSPDGQPAAPAAPAAGAPPTQPQDQQPAQAQPPQPGQAAQPQQYTPAQLQAFHSELQGREQQITKIYQDVQTVLNNPQFQAAYKQITQGQAHGQAQTGAAAQTSPPNVADLLGKFVPETENEKVLVDVIRQQVQAAQEMRGTLDQFGQKFGRYERDSETAMMRQFDQSITDGLGKVKSRFPELIDGGQKEAQLMQVASQRIYAATMMRQPITLEQALDESAKLLSFDSLEDRAKQSVQQRARASASARVETPGPDASPAQPDSIEDALARSYDSMQ